MHNKSQWPLTLYFDGQCPLCAREINLLRRRASEARLLLIDISDDDFNAEGLEFSPVQMQSSLHACFADGRWVKGLDATLWAWRAAGMGVWVKPLTWRAFRPLFSVGYRLFCRLRPHLAWIPHPEGSRRCVQGRCEIPTPKSSSDGQPGS
jgi:predicted DCC family thiol-disulfide oxidoreductase YuxK